MGLSTYTTGDGVTLNPFNGGAAGSLNADAAFIGVSGGSNNNGVEDLGVIGGTHEVLDIVLDATVGLSQMVFKWSCAHGPLATDGIVISGFAADPVVSASSGVGITYSAGSAYLNYTYNYGTARAFDFGNLAASAGNTLSLSASDSTQAGGLAVIESITYDAVPEPATLGLVVALGGGSPLCSPPPSDVKDSERPVKLRARLRAPPYYAERPGSLAFFYENECKPVFIYKSGIAATVFYPVHQTTDIQLIVSSMEYTISEPVGKVCCVHETAAGCA